MTYKRNILSREDALERVLNETFERKTVSFYRYVKIQDPQTLRDQLFDEWSDLGILGRTYVSQEGINAQISVPVPQWDAFIANLERRKEFSKMPLKVGVEEKNNPSFIKNTIKIREQIVADGLDPDTYDVANVGKHLTAKEWNEYMEQEDTIVVDMRNGYESRIGHFEGAVTPDVDTFRDELPLVKEELEGNEDKKILLYCTGGVRCEKTSAYLKDAGFEDVNQLYGGIINYKHQIEEEGLENKFVGKNFVFDGRTEETISEDVISTCDVCKQLNDTIVNCSNVMCNLLFVQCENCSDLLQGACSMKCNEIVNLPKDVQKELRKNQTPTDERDYKKSLRSDLEPLSLTDKVTLMFRKWMRAFKKEQDQVTTIPGKCIGKVSHFYKNASVVEFILEGKELRAGDTLVLRGNTTSDYEVTVRELRVDGNPAKVAGTGDIVTIPVSTYIRKNDKIYLKEM